MDWEQVQVQVLVPAQVQVQVLVPAQVQVPAQDQPRLIKEREEIKSRCNAACFVHNNFNRSYRCCLSWLETSVHSNHC